MADFRRLRRFAGLAVALPALAASAAASPATASRPPYQPVWHVVFQSPKSSLGLVGVTAPAPDAAWAAGAVGSRHLKSFVVRWNGRSWRPGRFPVSGFTPYLIQSSSVTNVWIFGQTSAGVGEAFRWNGHGWRLVPEPAALARIAVTNADVISRDDVWIGGQRVYRWTGKRWLTVPMPAGFAVTALAGGRKSALWAVGTRGTGSSRPVEAYRREHARWQAVPMPHPRGFLAFAVVDARASVFVTVPHLASPDSTVLHWNGSRWRTLPAAPAPVSYEPVAAAGREGLWLSNDMLWNGRQWISVAVRTGHQTWGPLPGGNSIAEIPGTRSAWLAGYWCASDGSCRGYVLIAGKLPN